MAELLPIKFFSKRDEDKQRVEGNSSKDLPKWVLTGSELFERSLHLSTGMASIVDETEWETRTVPVIVQATMTKDAHAKSHRRKIESVFTTKPNNIIGVGDEDTLIIKVDSLEDAKEIQSRLMDTEKNAYGISGIEEISRFHTPVERSTRQANYKIKLFDFHDYSTNQSIHTRFEHMLVSRNVEFSRTVYTSTLVIYKLRDISILQLDELMQADLFEMAEEIVPMPIFDITLDSLPSQRVIPIRYPNENSKTTTVGVLDNGIEPIDHLRPWIEGRRESVYPNSSIQATHGTFVAGIITYGDKLQQKELTGSDNVKVFDGAVFPDLNKERLEEDELIENIREIIKMKHQEIKIWNLSISITREISGNKFSDFAVALDAIQDEYNVLICKAAGNCMNFASGKPLGRLNEGADSVRSLVVGSVAEKKEGADISEPNNPSPFSRKGPGPAYIIKPDIVHFGGNAGTDRTGRVLQTGVYSFAQNGYIIEKAGTSFSTPRVSALAAGLLNEMNEEFDPLLLKSLIIHSANYAPELLVPEVERTKYLGFGVPGTVRQILYNSPDEATLILRDTLPKGSYIDIKDFPMPDCLVVDGFYTGQVIVTLAYSPILDPSQGFEYCQSNMDVRFGTYDEKEARDTTRNGILNPVGRKGSQNILRGSLYSKLKMSDAIDDFALKERMLIQYADKYYPVKKYAVDLSELTEGNRIKYITGGKQWYLNLEGTYRSHTEDQAAINGTDLSQEFCLIITIKDPLHRGKAYNGITQKLNEYNFWYSNIKVSEHIAIVN